MLWKEILDKLDMQKIEKWLVMATLIATFTITTTFTLPRVYEDHGLNEEMAKFARKLDFVFFFEGVPSSGDENAMEVNKSQSGGDENAMEVKNSRLGLEPELNIEDGNGVMQYEEDIVSSLVMFMSLLKIHLDLGHPQLIPKILIIL
ncbi:hypothetical protein Q3G72_004555 [Acer saccharum]|nr:hypothetical protein Q3G72_004555 [Acer saccharum]